MLLAYTSQLSWINIANLLLLTICTYNLYQLVKQQYVIYFLGYKMLFLVYLGWWLIATNLDIAALILWIVYGSFIVVVFIFTFLWLDVSKLTTFYNHIKISKQNILIMFFCIMFGFAITNYLDSFSYYWTIAWVDYYTILNLQRTAEIECLGWIVSVVHPFLVIITSIILSITCVVCVVLVIASKKTKWVELLKHLKQKKWSQTIVAAAIRKQHIYQQEKNIFLRLNKAYKGYHRRRA